MPHACSSNQANRNGHGCRPPPSLEIQGPCQQKHGGQQPKRTKACCHSARWLQRMANCGRRMARRHARSEEHTSELQSPCNLVCRLLLEKKKTRNREYISARSQSRAPLSATSHTTATKDVSGRIIPL